MERILLITHQQRINKEKTNLITAANELEDIINTIGLPNVTIKEIESILVKQNLSCIADMYLARMDNTENLTVAGMPINREKFKELIQVDNADSIIKKAKEFTNKYLNKNHSDFRIYLSDISIDENKAIVRNDVDEYLHEKHSIYADTPKQIDITNKALQTKEALNSYLDEIGSTRNFYKEDFITGLIPVGSKIKGVHHSNSRVDIDIDFIKRK